MLCSQTFLTAAKSVTMNPVPIKHPMDATVLNGIGPYVRSHTDYTFDGLTPTLQIAKWLTKRLEEGCAEKGVPMPERNMEMTAARAAAKKHATGKQTKLSLKRVANAASDQNSDDEPAFAPGEFVGGISAPRGRDGSAVAESSSDDESRRVAPRKAPKSSTSKQGQGRRLGGDSDDEASQAQAKSKARINTSSSEKPRKKAKAYCPRVQTGAWAILVGLCSFGSDVWKSQADIVSIADPFFGKDGESLGDKKAGASGKQQFITGWRSVGAQRGKRNAADRTC